MQRNHKNKKAAITTSSDFESVFKEIFLPHLSASGPINSRKDFLQAINNM